MFARVTLGSLLLPLAAASTVQEALEVVQNALLAVQGALLAIEGLATPESVAAHASYEGAASATSEIFAEFTGETHHGWGTVFMQDGNAGSCGEWNDDDSYIVALGNDWMQWQYEGPECGRQVRVKNLGSDYGVGGEGNSIIATVADTCDSCDATHVDFSVGAWNALTDHSEWSQLNIQWEFI